MRGVALDLGLLAAAATCALFGYGLPQFGGDDFVPGPREPNTLRVVTWNVGRADGGGGRALAGEHIPVVVETLRALEADLVFLLELESRGQLERIRDELGGGLRSTASRGGRRIGALAKDGVLIRLRLEDPVGRSPLAVLFQKGDLALNAIAVHAHPWSAERRNEEIGRIVNVLEESRVAPVRLLVGDLNLDLDRRGRGDLFTDNEHLDVETYNYVAERFVDAGAGTGPTAEPDRRLDYVFYAGDGLEPLAAGPWRGRRADGMDHDPLVADFRIRR